MPYISSKQKYPFLQKLPYTIWRNGMSHQMCRPHQDTEVWKETGCLRGENYSEADLSERSTCSAEKEIKQRSWGNPETQKRYAVQRIEKSTQGVNEKFTEDKPQREPKLVRKPFSWRHTNTKEASILSRRRKFTIGGSSCQKPLLNII